MSDLDTTIALITTDEYLEMNGLDPSNSRIGVKQIELLINAESQRFIDECGRKFITPSEDVTETFSGDGESEYYVRHCHISSLTKAQYRLDETWNDLDSTNYPLSTDSDTGRIWFTRQNSSFWEGKDNWRVLYKYGWAQASIPDSLKLACALMVRRDVLKVEGKEGVQSESFGDVTTSFNLSTIPDDIKQVLNRYRRVVGG